MALANQFRAAPRRCVRRTARISGSLKWPAGQVSLCLSCAFRNADLVGAFTSASYNASADRSAATVWAGCVSIGGVVHRARVGACKTVPTSQQCGECRLPRNTGREASRPQLHSRAGVIQPTKYPRTLKLDPALGPVTRAGAHLELLHRFIRQVNMNFSEPFIWIWLGIVGDCITVSQILTN